jgi:signal transduction histidine kinase
MSRNGWLAAGLGAYCLGSLALFVVLRADGHIPSDHAGLLGPIAVMLLELPVVVVLLRHLPSHPVTVLLAVYVVGQLTALGPGNALVALAESGWLEREVAVRIGNAMWIGSLPVLSLLIMVFPDGVPTGWWRRLFQAQVVTLVVLAGTALLDNPEDGLHPITAVVSVAGAAVLIVAGACAAVRLALRAVRDREIRRQVVPFAAVATAIVAMYVVIGPLTLVVPSMRAVTDNELVYVALTVGLPVAIGYAVVRHRLYGINVVLTRLVLAATAMLVLALAYLGAVLGIAAALGVPRGSLPALLVPAVLTGFVLAPAYAGLHRLLLRTVYGSRGDPLTVIRTLGERLARTAPDDAADRIVDAVRTTLKLSWVAIEVAHEDAFIRAAEAGAVADGATVERFDLSYAGALPGRLLVQPRRGEQALSRVDRRLLRAVAYQAGPAVAAAQYVQELTLSRERLVLGREQERSRLRRDLHDGLSPALAGISLALNAARRMLRSDPGRVDALLGTAESEASRSWADVRRILNDLRPPGLHELGLVGALEERSQTLSRPGEFAVTVIADGLPPLPATVETAAYRIAVEAMANSARHAQARQCTVMMSADGALHLCVQDDGSGLPGELSPGVGIASMRARAVDLGGQLYLGTMPGGGTRVEANLPLPAARS